MDCAIQWRTDMSRDEWGDLLQKCDHSTLLQSYYYAQAMREVKQQSVRHGVITIDGKEAGIVQLQEVSLLKQFIHAISIDRGPLWFDGYGKEKHLQAFAQAVHHEFPHRFGRKRRFLPEYHVKNAMISVNYWNKNQKIGQYYTHIVKISDNLEKIRQNLKQKWRNILNKAEKNRLSIVIDENCETLGDFLSHYIKDRIEKRYAGVSPKFLAALAKYASMEGECLIMNATEDDETIASIIVFIHGKGATYQAGWTTPYGRDKGAHHLLLWRAIEILKDRGVKEFDLGGHNHDTPGIKTFKAGLGGHEIALIGSYG
jgi:hypothetical protein